MAAGRYARAVAKVPYVFIIVDVVLAFVLGPLTAYYHGVPDFSDPLSGFEPRGTPIRGWTNAAYFIHQTMVSGEFQLAPGISYKQTESGEDAIDMGGVLPDSETAIVTDFKQPMKMPRIAIVPVVTGMNMLTLPVLQSICQFKYDAIVQHCEPDCTVMSITDVISELRGTTCDELTETDVVLITSLLQKCAPHYFNGGLRRRCNGTNCLGIPFECQDKGAVFRIFNDFTDKEFMEDGDINKVLLSHTMLFIQWKKSSDSLRAYFTEKLGENDVSNNLVKVKGINLTIPRVFFRWYIIQDLVWYGLAMGVVVLLLVMYLRSFILMLTVVLNVLFSLLLAYWIYFMILRFTFFPFINILAALLLIALGADDLFIFYDIWREEKLQNPGAKYEDLVSVILYKGGMSVFVTSFTTATALLANFVNDVTAIRCFGAFAAVCVFVNFLLFITWVPAIIVITDVAYTSCMGDDFCHDKTSRVWQCLLNTHTNIWKRLMPNMIIKGAPFWIILIMGVTVGGLVATFYTPRLNLPTTNGFRLLVPEHPFEVYEWQVKEKMRFEKNDNVPINCQFLWGANGVDNGNKLDPEKIGHLSPDPGFDIYTGASQIWLSDVCDNLLKEDFIDDDFKGNAKCYWEYYRDYIAKPCDPRGTRQCCEQTFPPPYNVSKLCMAELAYGMHSQQAPVNQSETMVGLPLFNKESTVVTFQMFFKTPYIWTANYGTISRIYSKIKDFTTGQLHSAPASADNGWFTGAYLYEFKFFDLQKSLALGTLSGIGVSLAIGFFVLLVTTFNIFLTCYAIVTIALVLSTTTGVLALMGWELNTTEALILTLSMGLSIDFTIHNGMAYKLADEVSREDKVRDTLSSVGSAITMAGLTTFGAGAAMMCGSVWAYRQFGIFLVLTMVISWFYANFFFLSMCSTIGPTGSVGDFSCAFVWVKKLCGKTTKKTNNDKISHIDNTASVHPDRIRNAYVRSAASRRNPLPFPPAGDGFSAHNDLANFAYQNTGFEEPPQVPPRLPAGGDAYRDTHNGNNNSSYHGHRHSPQQGGDLHTQRSYPGSMASDSPSTSDSPQDFAYRHIKQHRAKKHRNPPYASSSSSTASFPNFYGRQDGDDTRFSPPCRNSYRNDSFDDVNRAVHLTGERH